MLATALLTTISPPPLDPFPSVETSMATYCIMPLPSQDSREGCCAHSGAKEADIHLKCNLTIFATRKKVFEEEDGLLLK